MIQKGLNGSSILFLYTLLLEKQHTWRPLWHILKIKEMICHEDVVQRQANLDRR